MRPQAIRHKVVELDKIFTAKHAETAEANKITIDFSLRAQRSLR